MKIKIGYIISRFPSTYQPWIAQELLAMKEKGFGVKIYSLKKPNQEIKHRDADTLMKEVYYVPFLFSFRLIYSQLYLLLTDPITYTSLLFYVIRHNYRDKVNLLKALSVFPKSVHYALKMREDGVRHIHAHWSTMPALSALVMSRILGIEYSITCHAVDVFDQTVMLEEKMEQAKFILTCTRHNKDHLVKTYPRIKAEKIFINYHGKDLKKIRRTGSPQKESVEVLSVGRLAESKGFQYLIKALYQIKTYNNLNFHCTIIGEGYYRSEIEGLIKKYDLQKNIALTGAIPYEQVIDYYERSHIFVLAMVGTPDRGFPHRGIPNVLAEAMAMEVPVITTNLPVIAELVDDGESGILVPEKDSEALKDAILELVHSESLRKRLVKSGRASVENIFDIQKTLNEMVTIFQNEVNA